MNASPMIAKVVDGVALLPCPFCGGEPCVSVGMKGDVPFTYIECEPCGATCGDGDTKEEAASAWNHRQP